MTFQLSTRQDDTNVNANKAGWLPNLPTALYLTLSGSDSQIQLQDYEG